FFLQETQALGAGNLPQGMRDERGRVMRDSRRKHVGSPRLLGERGCGSRVLLPNGGNGRWKWVGPGRGLAVLALLLLVVLAPVVAQEALPKPPVAPAKPHSFDFHGQKIDDPYSWIKDKKNPEAIKYIEAENAYREALTRHLKPLEDKLYKETLSHIKQTDLS